MKLIDNKWSVYFISFESIELISSYYSRRFGIQTLYIYTYVRRQKKNHFKWNVSPIVLWIENWKLLNSTFSKYSHVAAGVLKSEWASGQEKKTWPTNMNLMNCYLNDYKEEKEKKTLNPNCRIHCIFLYSF